MGGFAFVINSTVLFLVLADSLLVLLAWAATTGQALGDAVVLTTDKISKIDSGKRRIDVVELTAIADALVTTSQALLGKWERKSAP